MREEKTPALQLILTQSFTSTDEMVQRETHSKGEEESKGEGKHTKHET